MDAFVSPLVALFEIQRRAYAREPFPTWPKRRDRLERLGELLREHDAEIAMAIAHDFGHRSQTETQLVEVLPSVQSVKQALRYGRSWMRARRATTSRWFWPARSCVMPQPLGVVGIMVPWNYPLFLCFAPLVAALAAGNRALVKLSERTPEFARVFDELIKRRFSPDEVAVVHGDVDVASAFTRLPFDHLLFTGSTRVGRKVMRAASANLTPVTLELGGKSPCVIAPGYSLDKAAERIVFGKLINAGQTCIAPDYVVVPRNELNNFASACRTQAQQMYPSGLNQRDYCSVIDQHHYERLTQLIDDVVRQGARIEPLFAGPVRDDSTHRLAPLLVFDAPSNSALMREEIFGPVLPVIAYERVEDALSYIRRRPRPLALYWFDHDRRRTEHALRVTHAGGVAVNDTLIHVAQEGLPFGGIGPSGMGHYHGRWGFDTFSKLKPVFIQSRWNALSWFNPPWSERTQHVLEWIKRF